MLLQKHPSITANEDYSGTRLFIVSQKFIDVIFKSVRFSTTEINNKLRMNFLALHKDF